jgi:hypothetical protein
MKKIKTFITLEGYQKQDKEGYVVDFDTSLFIFKGGHNSYILTDIATGARVYEYTTSSYKKAMELCKKHYFEHDLRAALRYFKGTEAYKKLVEKMN